MNDPKTDKSAGNLGDAARWSLKLYDRDFELTAKATIGRAEGTEITLLATGVSRKHATVEPTPDGVMVVDLGSKNGTYIGGRRIESGLARAGDSIKLGDVSITVVALRPADNETIIMKPSNGASRVLPEPDAKPTPPRPEEKIDKRAPRETMKSNDAPAPEADAKPKAQESEMQAASRESAPPAEPAAPAKSEARPASGGEKRATPVDAKQDAEAPPRAEKRVEVDTPNERAAKKWWEQTSEGGALGTMLGGRVEDFAQSDAQAVASIQVTRPTLIGLSQSVTTRRVELDRDKYTIGRSVDNDIVIDDQYVSSQHAQLVLKDGAWFVNNILASNGTFVNGQKCQSSILTSGDRIRIGGAEWVFKAPKVEVTPKRGRKFELGNVVYFIGGILLTSGLFLLVLYFMRK